MNPDPNPYAFPLHGTRIQDKDGNPTETGMSLRDYFAGQALVKLTNTAAGNSPMSRTENAAKKAYEYADAMLLARQPKDSHEA